MSDIRIGISGWRYVPWRGDFYPKGLVQRKELQFASRTVNSIEINGSFYGSQTPERYANWCADTPEDFVFSIKAPRFITHLKRLRNIETPMANFFASGIFQLRQKLGPILWQFPPNFKFDEPLFRAFLELLPFDSDAAKRCASHCDPQMQTPLYLDIPAQQPLRHAIEIRNQSFLTADFVALLREFNVALVVADTAGKWPYVEDITSDFTYMRLHGDEELYASGYSETALERWCQRIKAWSHGQQPEDAHLIVTDTSKAKSQNAAKDKKTPRQKNKAADRDIYCYFDNDAKVRAPYDARRLLEMLDLTTTLEAKPGVLPESIREKK